jgi:RNA-binding protein 25
LRHIEASNDEETDAHERRRIERKIREKEAAYQERLRSFEMRERRKKREIEKQDERAIKHKVT